METNTKVATHYCGIATRKQFVRTSSKLKKPFGTAAFSRIRHAPCLAWEDALDAEFEDGLCLLDPRQAIRNERGIYVEIPYDTGEAAEVWWSSIRELQPNEQSPLRRA